jgi:hypothetical protein
VSTCHNEENTELKVGTENTVPAVLIIGCIVYIVVKFERIFISACHNTHLQIITYTQECPYAFKRPRNDFIITVI